MGDLKWRVPCSIVAVVMHTPSSGFPQGDTMTGVPIPFWFIEYLCAERGIDRVFALELVGTYLLARSSGADPEQVDVDQVVALNALDAKGNH
jgi:hypothetical protein